MFFCPASPSLVKHSQCTYGGPKDAPPEHSHRICPNQLPQVTALTTTKQRNNIRPHVVRVLLSEVLQGRKITNTIQYCFPTIDTSFVSQLHSCAKGKKLFQGLFLYLYLVFDLASKMLDNKSWFPHWGLHKERIVLVLLLKLL